MKKVEVVRCSRCGREIEDRTQFCSDCGSARSHLRAGRGVKIAISVVAFAALLFGLWVHLGTPVPASLGALVANQLLGGMNVLWDLIFRSWAARAL